MLNVIIEIAVDCDPIPNIIVLYSILSKYHRISKIRAIAQTIMRLKFYDSHLNFYFYPWNFTNLFYSSIDVPIFTFCALFSFSQGYYAICQGPSHGRKYLFYRITQVILIIAWFVFSIISAGPFDGWTKIGTLKECNLGFSIFLAVV